MMNTLKKMRVILIGVLLIILLLTINKYRVRYLNDYIGEADFVSLNIIQHEVDNIKYKEIQINDKEKIQQIYKYIVQHKVRRNINWGSGLKIEDNIYYDLYFITAQDKQNYAFTLLGDDYIILEDTHDSNKSIYLKYVDSHIDLNYFMKLITD